MSQDALSPRQFMYHASPTSNHSSIMEKGLTVPPTTIHHDQKHGHAGVYMFKHRSYANELSGMNIYKVHTSGLSLHQDPNHDPGDALYSRRNIPKSRVEYEGPSEGSEYA